MKTLAAANAELSRCVVASSGSVFDKSTIATPTPFAIRFNCLFPQGFPLLSSSLPERNRVCNGRLRSMFKNSSDDSMSYKSDDDLMSKHSESDDLMSKNSSDDESDGLTYKDAGVDIDAGAELVRRIRKLCPGIGGFGGLLPHDDNYCVAGTDGVGTKLKLAFETGIHNTVGIDLVAMSVNDIVTPGAKPLFFLDYFSTSRLNVDLAEKVIKGIVHGCEQSDCILLGGEMAEMPDFYAEGEYDLSGFAVGIVKPDSAISGENIVAGDVLIGLPSSGVHSNGFSLVRRVLARSGLSLKDQLPGATITLGEALMTPTVIYVKQVLDLIRKGGVKGVAHITGGGFTDNTPRVFLSIRILGKCRLCSNGYNRPGKSKMPR